MDTTTSTDSNSVQQKEESTFNVDQATFEQANGVGKVEGAVVETHTPRIPDPESPSVASNWDDSSEPKPDVYVHPPSSEVSLRTAQMVQDFCDRTDPDAAPESKEQAPIPGPAIFPSDESDTEDQMEITEPQSTETISVYALARAPTLAARFAANPSADMQTTQLLPSQIPRTTILPKACDAHEASTNLSVDNSTALAEPAGVSSSTATSQPLLPHAYTDPSIEQDVPAPQPILPTLDTVVPTIIASPKVAATKELPCMATAATPGSTFSDMEPTSFDPVPAIVCAPVPSAENDSVHSAVKTIDQPAIQEQSEPDGTLLAELEMSILSSKSLLENLLAKPDEPPVVVDRSPSPAPSVSMANQSSEVLVQEPVEETTAASLVDNPIRSVSEVEEPAPEIDSANFGTDTTLTGDALVTSLDAGLALPLQTINDLSSSSTNDLLESPPALQTSSVTNVVPALAATPSASDHSEEHTTMTLADASIITSALENPSTVDAHSNGSHLAHHALTSSDTTLSGDCAGTTTITTIETTLEISTDGDVDISNASEEDELGQTILAPVDSDTSGLSHDTAVQIVAEVVSFSVAMEVDTNSPQDEVHIKSGPDGYSMEEDTIKPQEDPNDADSDSAANPSSPYLPPSSPLASQVSDMHLRTIPADEPSQPSTPMHAEDDTMLDVVDDEDHALLPPSSPIRSSEAPTSSPPQLFTSSPPREYDFYSPPTSPQLSAQDKTWGRDSSSAECEERLQQDDVDTPTRKRGREEDVVEHGDYREVKCARYSPPPPPNPKRATLQGQKKTQKKLVQPFRSPIVKIEDIMAGKDGVYASGRPSISKKPVKVESPPPEAGPASVGAFYFKADMGPRIQPKVATKDRTANAAKPFKALLSPSDTTKGKGGVRTSSANAGPTIQTLQARVQKLKQAIKIKNERDADDDERLETLVTKWRTVGREVAWLIWDIVKDLAPGEELSSTARGGGWNEDAAPRGNKSAFKVDGFQSGWGWDGEKKGKHDGLDNNWGWDDKQIASVAEGEDGIAVGEPMEVDEEEPQVENHSLGTMLRHLGIDPDTLGWDEDEGDFVGDP